MADPICVAVGAALSREGPVFQLSIARASGPAALRAYLREQLGRPEANTGRFSINRSRELFAFRFVLLRGVLRVQLCLISLSRCSSTARTIPECRSVLWRTPLKSAYFCAAEVLYDSECSLILPEAIFSQLIVCSLSRLEHFIPCPCLIAPRQCVLLLFLADT